MKKPLFAYVEITREQDGWFTIKGEGKEDDHVKVVERAIKKAERRQRKVAYTIGEFYSIGATITNFD